MVMPMKDDVVEYYVGHKIKPKPGCSFYLVRAEFGNGSTGDYHVGVNLAGDLIVQQMSHYGYDATTRSALVVMLRKKPKRVNLAFSGG